MWPDNKPDLFSKEKIKEKQISYEESNWNFVLKSVKVVY